jgi:hypothetical protein
MRPWQRRADQRLAELEQQHRMLTQEVRPCHFVAAPVGSMCIRLIAWVEVVGSRPRGWCRSRACDALALHCHEALYLRRWLEGWCVLTRVGGALCGTAEPAAVADGAAEQQPIDSPFDDWALCSQEAMEGCLIRGKLTRVVLSCTEPAAVADGAAEQQPDQGAQGQPHPRPRRPRGLHRQTGPRPTGATWCRIQKLRHSE